MHKLFSPAPRRIVYTSGAEKKANKNTRQKDGCNLCCALIVKFCF